MEKGLFHVGSAPAIKYFLLGPVAILVLSQTSIATSIRGPEDGALREARKSTDSKTCESFRLGSNKARCQLYVATNTKDQGQCGKIEEKFFKDECYIELAIAAQDTAICANVTSPGAIATCEAIKAKDPKACPGGQRDYKFESCIYGLARALRDPKVCDAFHNKSHTKSCKTRIAIQTGSSELCFETGDSSCFRGLFDSLPKAKLRSDLCHPPTGFAQSKLTNRRINECAQILAIAAGNVDLCPLSKVGKVDDRCLNEIADRNKNAETCAAIQNEQLRSDCFSRVGGASGNATACRRATKGSRRDSCFVSVADKKSDLSLCLKVDDPEQREMCLYNVSSGGEDAGSCKKLQAPGLSARCLSAVAKNTKNPELCKSLNELKAKDVCYFDVSLSLGKAELCNRVENREIENYCKALVAREPQGCGLLKNHKQDQECRRNVKALIGDHDGIPILNFNSIYADK